MILFTVYFLLICFFIYRYNLFGITKDSTLNKNFFLIAFIIKSAGLAVFHVVYIKIYGSINYSDTYNYFHESQILQSVADWNFWEYVKLIFGFQDDSPNTELFNNYLRFTTVWDNDPNEMLYNDNRLLLRIHSLIHFISNHNYYIHALISSLLAFIGITWIYKAFKILFIGKEILFFSCWLLFPGLWFWSAALLKEGPALYIMGMLLVSMKRIWENKMYGMKNICMFLLSAILSMVFKQYILFPLLLFSVLYFTLEFRLIFLGRKGLIFIIVLFVSFMTTNSIFKNVKGKAITEILSERQAMFIDMSNGGIFLLDKTKFIRLPYDTTKIKSIRIENETDKYVTINSGAKYAYCEHTHQQDTLYCDNNTDTLSEYLLYYVVPKANATIHVQRVGKTFFDFFVALPEVIYITLCKPLFYDSRNAMDYVASVENAFILFAITLLIYLVVVKKNKYSWVVYWMSYMFFELIVIGITSPNIGAIQRYRVVVMPFLFMCTLYALNVNDSILSCNLFKSQQDK